MANLVDVIADAEKQIGVLLNKHVKIVVETITGANAKIDELRYIVWDTECDEKVPTKFWFTSQLALFSLTQLPGCCGICVSYHSYVSEPVRRKGLGTLLCSVRKDIAKALGYGCMLCTDVVKNGAQKRILDKNGWKETHRFLNPRTDNNVNIHVVDL